MFNAVLPGFLDPSPCCSLLSVHSFKTGDTAATRLITGETPPTAQKLLQLAYPWIGFADFYVCFIGYALVFVPFL